MIRLLSEHKDILVVKGEVDVIFYVFNDSDEEVEVSIRPENVSEMVPCGSKVKRVDPGKTESLSIRFFTPINSHDFETETILVLSSGIKKVKTVKISTLITANQFTNRLTSSEALYTQMVDEINNTRRKLKNMTGYCSMAKAEVEWKRKISDK